MVFCCSLNAISNQENGQYILLEIGVDTQCKTMNYQFGSKNMTDVEVIINNFRDVRCLGHFLGNNKLFLNFIYGPGINVHCPPKVPSHVSSFFTTDFTDVSNTIKSYYMNYLEHKSTINIVKTLKESHKAEPMTFFKKQYGNKNVKHLRKHKG